MSDIKIKVPKGFGPAKREEYLEHVRAGVLRGAAAELLGYRRKLILDYIDADSAFEELVLDAEREALEHVEEALYHAAISGSVPAAKTWLELRGMEMPEHRGRPRKPEPPPPENPFGDLDNVASLDPRRRRKQSG